MDADCTSCGKPTRLFGDVLDEFATLRFHLHIALHTPELLSKLREAMELVAAVESECHGLCQSCARSEAVQTVQREMDACAKACPKHLRTSLLAVIEERVSRTQQAAPALRLVKASEGTP